VTKAIGSDGEPYWKVRVVFPGVVLHLASKTEPIVEKYIDNDTLELTRRVKADWLTDDRADTLGYIDWSSIKAVTWRRTV
jgi:hypothetical protein